MEIFIREGGVDSGFFFIFLTIMGKNDIGTRNEGYYCSTFPSSGPKMEISILFLDPFI